MMLHGKPIFLFLLASAFTFAAFLPSSVDADTMCRHSNGVSYRNGEEWEERNAFIMRCTVYDNGSWKTEVIACVMPGTGRRIPIHQSAVNGNDEWKCQMNSGGMVSLVQGPNPNAKCDGHSVGSRWQEKSFELECRPGGVRRLISCITEDGQRVPVNGSKEVGGFTLVCQQFGNGTVIFHGAKSLKPHQMKAGGGGGGSEHSLSSSSSSSSYSMPVMKCIDESGSQRSVGEHWVENHRFNKTCRGSGAVEVVNCINRDGFAIPLNSQLIREGTKYSCEMTQQGTIRFAAGPVE